MVVSNRAPPRKGPGPQAPVLGPAVRSGTPARCPLLASGDRAMACVTGAAIPGGPRNLAVRHARGGVALVVPLPDASNAQHVVDAQARRSVRAARAPVVGLGGSDVVELGIRGGARFDTTIVRTLRARLSVGRSARPRAADVQARRSDERLARDMQRYSLSNHRQAKSRETCNVIHYQTIGKRKIPFRDRPSLMMTLIDGRRLPWNFEIGS